ncbi:HIT domain-containing protein [Aquibacillus halophilus]|uniref:HIT domain-containing protein n=1 Tax=Aquibacillus halophilus TaxID=930132 RepID=A0A6A8DEW6_9BACI|nr:HIT family protein [Aquibacillus halophilus]MRH44134.1 HIT domain-containing protein [Aquibacillus halophilus]
MSHSEDCLFCKIVNGEIPSAKVYEDDYVYAFLDISQVTKGHTLIIPKDHFKDIYETPSDVAAQLFNRVPIVAKAIKEAYQPIGLNVLNNNEEPAGQSVFHIHIHLIPRYGKGDGFGAVWKTNSDDYTKEDLQKIASDITNQINT